MSEALWAAVDSITKPSTVAVNRVEDADWLAEIADTAYQGTCSVAAYRAATAGHATIPSLWEQATNALTGGEVGGAGSKPLRERSPADMDLMEIMSLIRETTRDELERFGEDRPRLKDGTRAPFRIGELRHLASVALVKQPDRLWWWEYRFDQWARLLNAYLRATDRQPSSVRLRGVPCEVCAATTVLVDGEPDPIVAPAVVVDFKDGYVRAAVCEACGHAIWRGELQDWAHRLGISGEKMPA